MKIAYSAPAKVILSGEHAVVYGRPALVSTINLRLKFIVTNFVRSSKDGKDDKEIFFISKEVKNYLINQKINFTDKRFNFKIESEIPIGRGLGSSAALSVASAAAFLEFYTGQVFKKEIINNLAYEIEKHFHQNPSGVDNSASCFGGLIFYQKNISLEKLNFKIPKKIEEKLFLIDSGKPKETTGEMVSLVRAKISQEILNEIAMSTKKLEESIERKNVNLFQECLVDNEKMLEKLEVVSIKTKKLIAALTKFGVGKVTGAGGYKTNSGYIFFYADKKEKLLNYLNKKKISYNKFAVDNTGLKKL